MTYATLQQVKETVPTRDLQLLTDFDGAGDVIVDARIEAALADATAEMNGWLTKAVSLPIANPPEYLSVVCRDLAMYRLHVNVGRVTDSQEKLRDAAIAYLKLVARGEASIGDETAEDTIETSDGIITAEGPDRVMTRDNLRRF